VGKAMPAVQVRVGTHKRKNSACGWKVMQIKDSQGEMSPVIG
jgi:hypothetical protein